MLNPTPMGWSMNSSPLLELQTTARSCPFVVRKIDRKLDDVRFEKCVPAIPSAFVAGEFHLLVHAPWPELVEASDEAGAAGPAVEPQHDRRLGESPHVVRCFVVHVVEARFSLCADREVSRHGRNRFLREIGELRVCSCGTLVLRASDLQVFLQRVLQTGNRQCNGGIVVHLAPKIPRLHNRFTF
ncbi:hypothetical protein M758_UG034300 [Ceratodon purpureus]|nr:hypothetical protein M758_UG034300 [Ceratodon purpureus]